MEKVNKKNVAALLSESIHKTITSVEKARAGKKLNKLVGRSAKKLAKHLVEQIRRDAKRATRVGKSLQGVETKLAGKDKKKDKKK